MKHFFWLLATFFLSLSYTSCTEAIIEPPEMEEEEEEEVEMIIADAKAANGGCPDTMQPVYLEKDGILLIEFESGNYAETDWKLDSVLTGFSSNGYLVWRGSDNFNLPGRGNLKFKIRVENTGRYRFVWKSRITSGNSNTDFNDSWLRIADADHFYGQKDNGDIVYPKGSNQEPIEDSAGQQNTTPEGSGSNGWFKVYMNTVGKWHWRSTTSDNDPHQIYVVFDEPGDYTIEISGRSTGHGIDRFVLFNDGYDVATATRDTRSLSEVICE